MSELIAFLARHSKWFVFTLLVAISITLLVRNDPYRQHLYLTSAGRLASSAYKGANNVTSYFNLHDINEDLNRQNAQPPSISRSGYALRMRSVTSRDILHSASSLDPKLL